MFTEKDLCDTESIAMGHESILPRKYCGSEITILILR